MGKTISGVYLENLLTAGSLPSVLNFWARPVSWLPCPNKVLGILTPRRKSGRGAAQEAIACTGDGVALSPGTRICGIF